MTCSCWMFEVNFICIFGDWTIGKSFTLHSSFWNLMWFLISFEVVLEVERINSILPLVIWYRNSNPWLLHCYNNWWSFPCQLWILKCHMVFIWILVAIIPSHYKSWQDHKYTITENRIPSLGEIDSLLTSVEVGDSNYGLYCMWFS